MSEAVILSRSKYVMARRRINIALCIIEDGHFNLLTSENLVEILNSALTELDEAVEQGHAGTSSERGLDWNAYEVIANS